MTAFSEATRSEGKSTFDNAAGNIANKYGKGKLGDKLVTLKNDIT